MARRLQTVSYTHLDVYKRQPVPLREYASLDKQAVIVGAGDHVEIGSREKYDFYDEQVAESMEELVEGLEGIML